MSIARGIEGKARKLRRIWMRRLLFGAVVAMFSSAAIVTSASADPYWQTFTKTSKWHCTYLPWHPPGLATETCIVVNGEYTQSVAIARNNTAFSYTIKAPNVRLYRSGALMYDRNCLRSTLSPGYSRACFAPTQKHACGNAVQAQTRISINGTEDWRFSPTRSMCST